MTYRVWAPEAKRVAVRVDGRDHPMSPDPATDPAAAGWWSSDLRARAGVDYAFVVDGAEPLPDPRSRWQPHGVHQPSRVWDRTAYVWGDEDWTGRELTGAVLYELHVGTFTAEGTLDAAVDRLDHLVELGIDLIELLPLNAFDGPHGWGYDGVLWGAVHEPYGGPDAFCRFVDACHQRGLGVILDVVFNHLGPSGAYLDRFGPYFAGETDWGAGLNLDGPGSDEVRRYVCDIALGWLRDFHVDGLRIDAVHALADHRAIHLLEQLSAETAALETELDRPLTLIAESDLNDPRMVTPRAEQGQGYGLGMDAQWCDDVHHALHVALTGETDGYYADFAAPGALGLTLSRAFFHADTWSSFRGRRHGREIDTGTVPAGRFVTYLQNHDQVGNRATGDRHAATVSIDRLACGAALLLCSPYTPMLFMGEEWGASTPWPFFASFPDPELAQAVREGRRREFGRHGWGTAEIPDPLDPATFASARLDFAEAARPGHRDVLGVYTDLIRLRHRRAELNDPAFASMSLDVAEDGTTVRMDRGGLTLMVNLGAGRLAVPGGTALLSHGTVDADGVGPDSFTLVDRQ